MKELMLLIPLGSALLLTGCAGTETEFQCNATTSDTCMTMEQANEKAKLKEERSDAKPAAAGLPRLADGNFRTTSPNSYPLPPQPVINPGRNTAPSVTVSNKPGFLNTVPVNYDDVLRTRTAPVYIRPVSLREGANKQVISSQADSLIKISRIWADFFPANTSNQPI
ncbi:type IV conjugative transfer system lipoprotein TraV [Klebsiella pneumoniae]|uniref:type IV conjugative transfer system lipoprotein TraV n=3 Tax=Klebsiella pneumoniae TaxID=573 RepID=UPI00044FB36E|nr:type IV conjugative transfer system protein TraV [Klebsiella pneumoniae BIDMC 12B]